MISFLSFFFFFILILLSALVCLELPTERFLVQFGFVDAHTREGVPISPLNFISLESRDRETVHFFVALLLPALPHRLLAGLMQLKRGSQSPVAVDVIDVRR